MNSELYIPPPVKIENKVDYFELLEKEDAEKWIEKHSNNGVDDINKVKKKEDDKIYEIDETMTNVVGGIIWVTLFLLLMLFLLLIWFLKWLTDNLTMSTM